MLHVLRIHCIFMSQYHCSSTWVLPRLHDLNLDGKAVFFFLYFCWPPLQDLRWMARPHNSCILYSHDMINAAIELWHQAYWCSWLSDISCIQDEGLSSLKCHHDGFRLYNPKRICKAWHADAVEKMQCLSQISAWPSFLGLHAFPYILFSNPLHARTLWNNCNEFSRSPVPFKLNFRSWESIAQFPSMILMWRVTRCLACMVCILT